MAVSNVMGNTKSLSSILKAPAAPATESTITRWAAALPDVLIPNVEIMNFEHTEFRPVHPSAHRYRYEEDRTIARPKLSVKRSHAPSNHYDNNDANNGVDPSDANATIVTPERTTPTDTAASAKCTAADIRILFTHV